jgi:hypothetical protein
MHESLLRHGNFASAHAAEFVHPAESVKNDKTVDNCCG